MEYAQMMKDYKNNVSYHFSPRKNRKAIQKNGLIGGARSDIEILAASAYVDAHRSRNAPKDFYKTTAIYSYLEFSYIYSGYEEKEYSEEEIKIIGDYYETDIYAIDLTGIDWYIGSIGISNALLMYINIESWGSQEKELHQAALEYWHNLYSKEEFLSASKKVQKTDENWGLDEILIPRKVGPEKVTLIGTKKGNIFYPKPVIKEFIKEEYKQQTKEIYKWLKKNQNK